MHKCAVGAQGAEHRVGVGEPCTDRLTIIPVTTTVVVAIGTAGDAVVRC